MADDENNITDLPNNNQKQPKDPAQSVAAQFKEEKIKAKQQELKTAYAALVAADEAKAVAAKKCQQILEEIADIKSKPSLL